jgi:G3E family GTPase
MLTTADVILLTTDDEATDTALAVADHLAGLGTRVIESGLSSLRAGDLVAGPGVLGDALRRIDPLVERRRSAHDRAGVWTLTLDSERAFHPGRLRRNIHRLADHCVRSRDQFWVPSRPGSVCIWDGAGRQLSVGEQGPSRKNPPRTRIVITGIGDQRDAILSAFSDSLAFPDELDATSDGLDEWFPQGDH